MTDQTYHDITTSGNAQGARYGEGADTTGFGTSGASGIGSTTRDTGYGSGNTGLDTTSGSGIGSTSRDTTFGSGDTGLDTTSGSGIGSHTRNTTYGSGLGSSTGTGAGYGDNIDPLSRNTNTQSGLGSRSDNITSSSNNNNTGFGTTIGNNDTYIGNTGSKLGHTANAPAPGLNSQNPLRGSTTDATTGRETGTSNAEERGLSESQNAPGAAGTIGENIMGGMGYGGAQIERPKEDQGLGEKIVKFFGA